jgi:DNA repair protein RecN (Recombination protein N)
MALLAGVGTGAGVAHAGMPAGLTPRYDGFACGRDQTVASRIVRTPSLGKRAMLLRLSIKNLAIIDDLTIDLCPGFTVLTGETGAGKSIIIGALDLVLGERASADDVRSGCASAEVEALFDVSAMPRLVQLLAELNLAPGIERGGRDAAGAAEGPADLVVRREISAQGRTRCLVNGRLVPLGQLRRIGDLLVDLHGQHQHQSLLKVDLHREILDAFGGCEVSRALDAYRRLFQRHGEIVTRLKSLDRDEREVERQKGLLEFQWREIREARLEPGEDSALEAERRRLEHAEALRQGTAETIDLLYEGETQTPTVADLLARGEDLLASAARLDVSLQPLRDRLAAIRADASDVADSVRSYAVRLEHDPARLAEVQDRLHLIRQLKRKYGETIEDVLAAGSRFEAELHALTHSREEQERLEAERAKIERELASAADELSSKRRTAARGFSSGLRGHLAGMEMPKVEFEVRIERVEAGATAEEVCGEGLGEETIARGALASPEDALGAEPDGRAPKDDGGAPTLLFADGKRCRVREWGADQIEFLISPNVGEDLKPLRRIASGGELSRIMLGLKVLMSGQDQIPTLVFDEVDTGISGRTGARIGEKMAALGRERQIICITHLAQIAARAHHHFAVAKVRQKGRTLTRVERLEGERRLDEIARLLGGDEGSQIARRHAKELLAACSELRP